MSAGLGSISGRQFKQAFPEVEGSLSRERPGSSWADASDQRRKVDTAKPNQEAVQEYEEVWRSFEHNTLVDGNIPPSDILLLAKA